MENEGRSPGTERIRQTFQRREGLALGPTATPSATALRRGGDATEEKDFRPAFAIDTDRILHSQAFTRYIGKTQVFSLEENDHITRRVIHIQLLSRIARTIGRALGLNEDLIEAIALGHDIGHCPFGHEGERHLSAACRKHGIGNFVHSVQSVTFLDRVENRGRGLNLTLQVLDGILCHDGETHFRQIVPSRARTFADLDRICEEKREDPSVIVQPMTPEGVVVKLADTISYIGRDVEDAIGLGLLHREEIPREVTAVLGDTNGKIVYRLVENLIEESREGSALGFRDDVAGALERLKKFNYERIYLDPRVKADHHKVGRIFEILFEELLDDLRRGRKESPIAGFVGDREPRYRERSSPEEIVRDYLAGMTDEYLLHVFETAFLPRRLPRKF